MTNNKYLKLFLSILTLFVLLPINIQADEIDIPITSPYAYLYDLETNQVLYSKNAEEKIYPASMTKLMTAIIAVEHLNLDETITITSEMYSPFAGIDASVAGFSIGESPTVRDLLYGLLLPSGADSACVLAYAVTGNIDSFVLLMNDKVNELGLTNTHFTNTTGLHNPNQYSTCKDIAKICATAVQYDAIKEILQAKTYTTEPLLYHPDGLTLTDHISDALRYGITGFVGGKTGYTPDAGRCLASYAVINGMDCVLVTANADNANVPQNDAYDLYSYLSENYQRTTLIDSTESIQTITVKGGKDIKEIEVYPSDSCSVDLPITNNVQTSIDLPDELQAPITENTVVGQVVVTLDNTELCSSNIYVTQEIKESIPSIIYHFIKKNILWIMLVIIAFLVMHIRNTNIRKKKKRKKKAYKNGTSN